MATLTPEQIEAARAYLNGERTSVGLDALKFNGDFNINDPMYSGSNAANLFGAAQAMGYADPNDALAQILGTYTTDQVDWYRDQNFGDQYAADGYQNNAVNRASLDFATGVGFTNSDANRNNMMDNGGRFGWEGGADGGYTQSMRDVFGNVSPLIGQVPTTGGGSGGNSGGGGRGGMSSGGNPYLQELAGQMGQNWTDWLYESAFPGIRDQNVAAGGLGGSRAGVAQGLAIGKAGQGYASELAKLYGGAWESSQNRDLSRYGMDLSYDTAQRGLDYQGIGLGAQLMGMGNQQPWYGYGQMGNLLGGASGNNNTGTQTTNQGGGWGGLLGGALAGGALGRQAGWWGI